MYLVAKFNNGIADDNNNVAFVVMAFISTRRLWTNLSVKDPARPRDTLL